MTVAAVAPAKIELETAVAGTRMERSDGACALTLGPLNGRTRIVDLYQSSPCRALMPLVDDDEIFSAVMGVVLSAAAGRAGWTSHILALCLCLGEALQGEEAIGTP